jgi:hypothetical protein
MKNVTKMNRPLYSNRVSSLSKEVVRQMNTLEYKHNNLMHYFNPDLEKRAWVAINTKDTVKMEKIIKEFSQHLQ